MGSWIPQPPDYSMIRPGTALWWSTTNARWRRSSPTTSNDRFLRPTAALAGEAGSAGTTALDWARPQERRRRRSLGWGGRTDRVGAEHSPHGRRGDRTASNRRTPRRPGQDPHPDGQPPSWPASTLPGHSPDTQTGPRHDRGRCAGDHGVELTDTICTLATCRTRGDARQPPNRAFRAEYILNKHTFRSRYCPALRYCVRVVHLSRTS